MAITRRKINFTASVTYTAYPWGLPREGDVAAEDNYPVSCTSHCGVAAMNSADARARLISQYKARRNVVDITAVTLTLRFPHQDAALLAERDAA